MKTKLTELLGIKYPIIQGPMAWISDSKLAIAVGEAGGAGVIACGGRDATWLQKEINTIKNATSTPFGVNVPLLFKNRDELIMTAVKEKVPFITLGAGNPMPYVDMIKKAGIILICIVPNVKLAKRAEKSGVDAIIIEGMESGGHIGTLTTMALMTQVIPEVNIPVIAAGGFADGRGLAAAIVMGAAGIQMGTSFITAEECPVHPNFKKAVLNAVDTDSVVTGFTINHSVRCINNAFTEQYLKLEKSGAPSEDLDRLATGKTYKASIEGDVDNGCIMAGQNLNLLKEIKPVRVIISEIIEAAEETLLRAPELACIPKTNIHNKCS